MINSKKDSSFHQGEITLWITTLEGLYQATKKDVIIKGVDNEVYPCKKDIFKKTYDYEK